MKYCSQCGMEQRDDAAYCIRCGAPCTGAGSSVQDETGRIDSSAVRGKLQKKLIYILPAILLAAVLLYVLYSPARRSCQLVMDGRAEQAGELYRKRVEGNRMEAFFLRLLVPRSASAIFNAYTEEKIGYNEALERLKTLALLETPLNNAAKMAEKAESGFRAKQALEQAKEYGKEGDYRSAILSCRMVEETDERYAEAARMAGEMEERYKKEILEQTGSPESEADYAEARRRLESALAVLPDDRQLRDALNILQQSYALFVKYTVIPVARDYIAKGYYRDAIAMIDRALPYNEQDMDLKALRSKAVSLYEEFVSSQVEIYKDNYDQEGALRLVEHALEDLPGDPVFEQLHRELNSKDGD